VKVLVLNCGSSSVKYQLVETSLRKIEEDTEERLAEGLVSGIGLASAKIRHRAFAKKVVVERDEAILEHQVALEEALKLLVEGEGAVLGSLGEIDAVGHRFVHGGEEFTASAPIDDAVLARIRSCNALAPLHNPHNLKGYEIALELLPGRPHVAVFDTAFHQTMPRHAYLYAIPWSLYEKRRIRRYGFHGTSHRYVLARLARLLKRPRVETSAITVHLGNGCSMAAIKNGESVDTSMGFTPLEGLVMGTRSGDIDAAVPLSVMEHEEIGLHEANSLLNKFSGLAGLSGLSGDMRTLEKAASEGHERARVAIDVFCYRVKKYVGAYLAALDGEADALVFTGGIGENSAAIRAQCCAGLEKLGIELDPALNAAPPSIPPTELRPQLAERVVSKPGSRIRVCVIPTDEERTIARDTVRCLEPAIER
jgi:acetate kinase